MKYPKPDLPKETFQRLFNFLMQFQAKNQYFGKAWADLRIIEQQTLTELDTPLPPGVSELSKRLCQTPASTSLLLTSLEKRGLVSKSSVASLKKVGRYYLTKTGKRRVREADEISNHFMNVLTKNLPYKTQTSMHHFLIALADGLKAPPSIVRPGEHPLRVENRRVTRAFGLMNRSFLKSKLSNLDAQILYTIEKAPNITSNQLSRISKLAPSTFARIVQNLAENKLITKGKVLSSPRLLRFNLSEQGEQALRNLEMSGAESLRKVLTDQFAPIAAGAILECKEILSGWNPDAGNVDRGFKLIEDSKDYFGEVVATALFLETEQSEGNAYRPKPPKTSENSKLLLVYEKERIIFALRYQSSNNNIKISKFGISHEIGSSKLLRKLLNEWITNSKITPIPPYQSERLKAIIPGCF